MTVMLGFLFVASLLSQSVFVAVNGFILSPLLFHASESTAKIWTKVMSTKHEDEGKIMTVPLDAPQAFLYMGDKFYIRACYNKYYDIIMDKLFGKLNYFYISVTGTPGIGKSIFYFYFLNRYRLENPGKSVITASFGKLQNLKKCKLFRPNGEVEEYADTFGQPYIPRKKTVSWPKDTDCDLYLYDGPPLDNPSDVKMIAFTSPNFSWLDSMRKNPTHVTLFMPTWDLTELLAANEELELNIDENEIIKRYNLFGGSARYCLSTSDDFVSDGKKGISSALTKINGHDQLRDCYYGNADLNTVVHRLMHYFPQKNPRFADLAPASESISRMLAGRLKMRMDDNRQLLMMWLDGSEKGSSTAGFFFEQFVHERLSDGGQFEIRSLDDSSRSTIDINQTIGQYSRFNKSSIQDEIFEYVYRIPKASNFPSIDSLILTEKSVLMFQITRSERHPVKSSGLVSLLQPLGLLNDEQENSLSAQLIFVVPKGMGDKYKRQDIEYLEELTGTNLEFVECEKIPGIGSKKNQKLKDLGIENCEQLIEAYNRGEEKVGFLRGILENLRSSMVNATEAEALRLIPQYVIEMDYYPKSYESNSLSDSK